MTLMFLIKLSSVHKFKKTTTTTYVCFQLHPTILADGNKLLPVRREQKHTCIICLQTGEYAKMFTHMHTHERAAVRHGGMF